MSALRELQSDFAAAVFGGDSARLLRHCGGAGGRAEQGIAAYRRSVLANLAGAVQATYPLIEAIVGAAFLAAACRRYALARPSRSGDLNAYGSDFDDFLGQDEAAASLPYLPAVARLEWQVQQVYAAADGPAQDLALLAATAPEAWGELCFELDPAHAVLASDWPLARIWQVNQPGYAGDSAVDFDQAQTVLVQRRGQGIAVDPLSCGEADLLRALAAGQSLALAVAAAAEQAEFDLQSALGRFIANALLRQAYRDDK